MAYRHGHNEPHYLFAMRQCIDDGIKIYPVNVGGFYYIEINDNGWLWTSDERYKTKARWKKDKHWDKEIFKLYQTILIIKQMNKKNILEEAAGILYERDSQKAKDYGPFKDAMKRAAKMYTLISGKPMSTRDFYIAMMALKLTRLQHSDKHDTYLDLIAYIASASELKDEPLIPKDFE